MPLDLSDSESAFLYGRAEFNKWADEFHQRWYMPDITLMLAASVIDAIKAGRGFDPAVINTGKFLRKLTGKEK